jgi:hypothetical protein
MVRLAFADISCDVSRQLLPPDFMRRVPRARRFQRPERLVDRGDDHGAEDRIGNAPVLVDGGNRFDHARIATVDDKDRDIRWKRRQ